MIIDGKFVASGSYNLSNNFEQNSLENLVIYSADGFPKLVQAFIDNFEAMWTTGEPASRYERLMEEITTGSDPVLLDFPPMALTWEQVTALRNAIYVACPQDEAFFANHPQCQR